MNRLIFIIGIALLLAAPGLAAAADLEVTCVASGGGISCSSVPASGPLFDEDNVLPGDTVTRDLKVINEYSQSCALEVDTKDETVTTANFTDELFTVIKDTVDRFGVSDGAKAVSVKNLSDVFAAGPIALGTLAANSVTDYQWVITFDPAAGNVWQGANTTFNFDAIFSCSEGQVSGDGNGDNTDCCPGADPTVSPSPSPPPTVLGAATDGGGSASGGLTRFPVTGVEGIDKWLQGSDRNWSRVVVGWLAVVLLAYWIIRTVSNRRRTSQ